MTSHKIFLSYRRGDSAGYTDSLYKDLVDRYGSEAVFYDRTRIEPGSPFPTTIRDSVSQAEIVLVVIGGRWLTIEDDDGHRRLDDPKDWVVEEIGLALAGTGKVVPVLVEGTRMPAGSGLPERIRELATMQAVEVTPERWDADLKRLRLALDRLLLGRRRRLPGRSAIAAAAVAMAVASLAWLTDLASVPAVSWLQRSFENQLGRQVPAILGGDGLALVEIKDQDWTVEQRRLAYAELLTVLSEADAEVVAFDAYFDWDLESPKSEADQKLADAIVAAKSRGTRVVVASLGVPSTAEGIPESSRLPILRDPLPEWLAESVGESWGYVTPESSTGSGSSFIKVELGRLKYNGRMARSGDLWATLPLRASMNHLGATRARYDPETNSIQLCGPTRPDGDGGTNPACDSSDPVHHLSIPVEKLTRTVADLQTATANKQQVAEILLFSLQQATAGAFQDRTRRAEDVDLLRRARERFVLVGSKRERTREAFGGLYGYQVNAQVWANIQAGRFLRPASFGVVSFLIAVAAFLGSAWRRRKRRPLEISDPSSTYKHWGWSLVDLTAGSLGLGLLAYLTALLTFMARGVILPAPTLLLAFATAYLCLAAIERQRAT